MTEPTTARRAVPAAERTHSGPDIWCEDLVRIHVTEGIEVQALQGLSLTVDPGEVVAVIGASGSGRCSTSSRGSTNPPAGEPGSRGRTWAR